MGEQPKQEDGVISTFLSNRDGGLTDEEGHYRFQTNVWDGEVIGDGLMVTENSPLGMSVLVNGGDAKVPYLDYAYTVWVPDGSPEQATITTADPTNPRIDRVVFYVDRGESPQQVTPNNPSIPIVAVIAGTPAAVPVRPTDGAVDTAVSNNPWIDLADVLVGAGVTQITDSNITDTRVPITVTEAKLNLPYGRIYYSTTGSGGGQVISGTSSAELNFNTLDPDSVDVTSPGTGELQLNTAGVYHIAAHAAVVDSPQDTNQLIRIQASTDDGSTWFQIVAWSQTNAGYDTTNRSISASTVVKLPANARVRAGYANSDTSAIRLAALNANDQKYTCSLVVAM